MDRVVGELKQGYNITVETIDASVEEARPEEAKNEEEEEEEKIDKETG